jgi:protein-S-isoprenylcysteine O-methyltransferase Ste14
VADVKQMTWASVLLTLLALAIVYGVGTAFVSIELERWIERTITPHLVASSRVTSMSREIYAGLDRFMVARNVRAVGYACVVLVLLLSLVGLVAERRRLAFLGSMGFILAIYAYFVLHMSFLAGLQVLTALWAPFWGKLVKLGDIAFLPYVMLVYPFSLAGLDIRQSLTGILASAGLLIFVLGVLTWFQARVQQMGTAETWIYRFTRHPQYLGWIIWSYALMLRVSLRDDALLETTNRGASLPWVISTLIIVSIALSEEIHMRRAQGQEYERYSHRAPFLVPLPESLSRLFSAPLRLVLGKEWPETNRDLVWTFAIYLVVIAFLSVPFVVLDWPPGGGWADWPSRTPR